MASPRAPAVSDAAADELAREEKHVRDLEEQYERQRVALREAQRRLQAQEGERRRREAALLAQKLKEADETARAEREARERLSNEIATARAAVEAAQQEDDAVHRKVAELEEEQLFETLYVKQLELDAVREDLAALEGAIEQRERVVASVAEERRRREGKCVTDLASLLAKGETLQRELGDGAYDEEERRRLAAHVLMPGADSEARFSGLLEEALQKRRRRLEESAAQAQARIRQLNEKRAALEAEHARVAQRRRQLELLAAQGADVLEAVELKEAPPLEFLISNAEEDKEEDADEKGAPPSGDAGLLLQPAKAAPLLSALEERIAKLRADHEADVIAASTHGPPPAEPAAPTPPPQSPRTRLVREIVCEIAAGAVDSLMPPPEEELLRRAALVERQRRELELRTRREAEQQHRARLVNTLLSEVVEEMTLDVVEELRDVGALACAMARTLILSAAAGAGKDPRPAPSASMRSALAEFAKRRSRRLASNGAALASDANSEALLAISGARSARFLQPAYRLSVEEVAVGDDAPAAALLAPGAAGAGERSGRSLFGLGKRKEPQVPQTKVAAASHVVVLQSEGDALLETTGQVQSELNAAAAPYAPLRSLLTSEFADGLAAGMEVLCFPPHESLRFYPPSVSEDAAGAFAAWEVAFWRSVAVTNLPRVEVPPRLSTRVGLFTCLRVSPDGLWLAVGSSLGCILVYSLLESPPKLMRLLLPGEKISGRRDEDSGTPHPIQELQWSARGSELCARSADGSVRVWSVSFSSLRTGVALDAEERKRGDVVTVPRQLAVLAPREFHRPERCEDPTPEQLASLAPARVAFFPTFTAGGRQPLLMVALRSGTLLRFHTQPGVSSLASPDAAPFEPSFEPPQPASTRFAANRQSRQRQRLFFQGGHEATIVLHSAVRWRDTNNRSRSGWLSLDANGVVCVWEAREPHFSGLGWYQPAYKARIRFALDAYEPDTTAKGAGRRDLFAAWLQKREHERRRPTRGGTRLSAISEEDDASDEEDQKVCDVTAAEEARLASAASAYLAALPELDLCHAPLRVESHANGERAALFLPRSFCSLGNARGTGDHGQHSTPEAHVFRFNGAGRLLQHQTVPVRRRVAQCTPQDAQMSRSLSELVVLFTAQPERESGSASQRTQGSVAELRRWSIGCGPVGGAEPPAQIQTLAPQISSDVALKAFAECSTLRSELTPDDADAPSLRLSPWRASFWLEDGERASLRLGPVIASAGSDHAYVLISRANAFHGRLLIFSLASGALVAEHRLSLPQLEEAARLEFAITSDASRLVVLSPCFPPSVSVFALADRSESDSRATASRLFRSGAMWRLDGERPTELRLERIGGVAAEKDSDSNFRHGNLFDERRFVTDLVRALVDRAVPPP